MKQIDDHGEAMAAYELAKGPLCAARTRLVDVLRQAHDEVNEISLRPARGGPYRQGKERTLRASCETAEAIGEE